MGLDSGAESRRGTSFCLGGLFLPILRRRGVFERMEKPSRDSGHFIHGSQERGFVDLGRSVKAADCSYKLERSSPNLFGSDKRIKIEKVFDVPADSL